MGANKKKALELVAKGTYSLTAVAGELNISVVTLYRWRQADAKFNEAMAIAVVEQDRVRVAVVEDQLFYRLSKGKASAVEMIFYLCNRDRDRWKHVQHVEHTGRDGEPIEVAEVVIERQQKKRAP